MFQGLKELKYKKNEPNLNIKFQIHSDAPVYKNSQEQQNVPQNRVAENKIQTLESKNE